MNIFNRKNFSITTKTILILFATVAVSSAMADSDDDVEYKRLDQGGVEIEFNNGCRVSFDRHGSRTEDRGGCKNKQLQRADEYAEDYLNDRNNSSGKGAHDKDIPEGKMAKYCKSEAADKLDIRPNHFNTNEVLRQGDKYLVNGYTDDHSATFACYFNKRNEFQYIEVHKYSNNQGPRGK